MNGKQLAQILAIILALDHLLLDAVLLENTTEMVFGKRMRLPLPRVQ